MLVHPCPDRVPTREQCADRYGDRSGDLPGSLMIARLAEQLGLQELRLSDQHGRQSGRTVPLAGVPDRGDRLEDVASGCRHARGQQVGSELGVRLARRSAGDLEPRLGGVRIVAVDGHTRKGQIGAPGLDGLRNPHPDEAIQRQSTDGVGLSQLTAHPVQVCQMRLCVEGRQRDHAKRARPRGIGEVFQRAGVVTGPQLGGSLVVDQQGRDGQPIDQTQGGEEARLPWYPATAGQQGLEVSRPTRLAECDELEQELTTAPLHLGEPAEPGPRGLEEFVDVRELTAHDECCRQPDGQSGVGEDLLPRHLREQRLELARRAPNGPAHHVSSRQVSRKLPVLSGQGVDDRQPGLTLLLEPSGGPTMQRPPLGLVGGSRTEKVEQQRMQPIPTETVADLVGERVASGQLGESSPAVGTAAEGDGQLWRDLIDDADPTEEVLPLGAEPLEDLPQQIVGDISVATGDGCQVRVRVIRCRGADRSQPEPGCPPLRGDHHLVDPLGAHRKPEGTEQLRRLNVVEGEILGAEVTQQPIQPHPVQRPEWIVTSDRHQP